jgi:PKD repeat protein
VNTINLYPNQTTTYTVTGVNSGGVCVGGYVNAAPVVVTVNSVPGLSATISGAGSICNGSSINLSVNITGSFPVNLTYFDGMNQYTVNGITSTPFLWTVNPTASTTYAIQNLSNLCNSNASTVSAVVTVNGSVTSASFSVMPMGGMDYYFTNTSANAMSYWWDFGDGTTFSTTTADTMHTYMAPGIYQVTLTAMGACGSQTSVQTITVVMTGTASSLDQVLAQVYPNPSNGQVFIELTGTTSTFDMTVENLQGQVIAEGQIVGGNRAEINLETTPGVYIVRLQNGEQTLVRKLVIQ